MAPPDPNARFADAGRTPVPGRDPGSGARAGPPWPGRAVGGVVSTVTKLVEEFGIKAIILFIFLVAHVLFSGLLAAPGHFSIDEGVYHLMAREFAATGGLGVWNGYRDFASPELALPTLLIRDGGLVPQYPNLYTMLAAPFYGLFGYRGLFLLNAFAFVGVVALCFAIARRLFRDSALALNACLVLVFATFAWQYSQAAWPHTVSALFVTLSVYLAVAAAQAATARTSVTLGLAAGLTVGIGTGVRLDTIFVLPAVLAPLLFFHPWRPRAGLAVCAGLLPGLAILAAINQAKFGIPSPFSYGATGTGGGGTAMTPYLPLAAAGLAVAIGAWVATRPRGRKLLESNPRPVALGVAIVCAVVLVTPQGWALASKLATGAYQLLVDFRIRDLAIQEGGLSRGPTGGMVYLGSLKKTLLQSCPYLIALALPLASLLRGKDVRGLGILFLVPAAFVAVYSYFAWHGGQALNLRYFVPALPFLAILTAYAWRDLSAGFRGPWPRVALAAGLAVFAVHFGIAYPRPAPIATQEAIVLGVPLGIAIALAVLLLAARVVKEGPGRALNGAASATMLAALVWGGMISMTYDFPRAYFTRSSRAEFSQTIAPLIAPDSILFVHFGDPFYGLIETRGVRFAMPALDDFESFRPLVDFHLEAGRPVYLWLAPEIAEVLEDRSLLDGLSAEALHVQEGGRLVRLTRARPAAR